MNIIVSMLRMSIILTCYHVAKYRIYVGTFSTPGIRKQISNRNTLYNRMLFFNQRQQILFIKKIYTTGKFDDEREKLEKV